MARETKAPRPAAAKTDYATRKDRAAAELERVHGVKAGNIPERVGKKLHVQNMAPQEATEQAAVSLITRGQPSIGSGGDEWEG
jgi:hypothetical protein